MYNFLLFILLLFLQKGYCQVNLIKDGCINEDLLELIKVRSDNLLQDSSLYVDQILFDKGTMIGNTYFCKVVKFLCRKMKPEITLNCIIEDNISSISNPNFFDNISFDSINLIRSISYRFINLNVFEMVVHGGFQQLILIPPIRSTLSISFKSFLNTCIHNPDFYFINIDAPNMRYFVSNNKLFCYNLVENKTIKILKFHCRRQAYK